MTQHRSATFEYGDHSVTMQRRFEAPMALVFEALTKPEHLSVWFPADDVELHVCEIDLRVAHPRIAAMTAHSPAVIAA